MKHALIFCAILMLAGCGGGEFEEEPEPTSVSIPLAASSAEPDTWVANVRALTDRQLARTSWQNATAEAVAVDVVLTSNRTLTADALMSGSVQPIAFLSVLMIERNQLAGPPFSGSFDTPPVFAGQSVAWSESVSWRVVVPPGESIEVVSIARLLPIDSNGQATLITRNLSLSVNPAP
jgi:hypothetical protein